ncbi:MAG: type II toxin-antitoxin system HicB family antitoxin [Candidatus Bathyarchaeia archaeon]
MKFHISIQKEPKGGYVVRCIELPGAMSQGETEEEAMANIKDAILTILDLMRETGEDVQIGPAEVRELVVA